MRNAKGYQLVPSAQIRHHITYIIRVHVGVDVVGVVKEGCHQGFPITSCAVFGGVFEER